MLKSALRDAGGNVIDRMADIRRVLLDLENRYLPSDMAPLEKDIFYAFVNVSGGDPEVRVTTEELRTSAFCQDVPQATYNRALRRLVDRGLVEYGDHLGHYYLSNQRELTRDIEEEDTPSAPGMACG